MGQKEASRVGREMVGERNTGNVESRSRVLGGWGGRRGAEREIEKEGFHVDLGTRGTRMVPRTTTQVAWRLQKG